jgi:hypothetical protein
MNKEAKERLVTIEQLRNDPQLREELNRFLIPLDMPLENKAQYTDNRDTQREQPDLGNCRIPA